MLRGGEDRDNEALARARNDDDDDDDLLNNACASRENRRKRGEQPEASDSEILAPIKL